MLKIELTDPRTGKQYKRIHRNSVERYLRNGKDVIMQACKLNPFGFMGHTTLFATDYNYDKDGFIIRIIHFQAICCNYESGYYPSFYVEV